MSTWWRVATNLLAGANLWGAELGGHVPFERQVVISCSSSKGGCAPCKSADSAKRQHSAFAVKSSVQFQLPCWREKQDICQSWYLPVYRSLLGVSLIFIKIFWNKSKSIACPTITDLLPTHHLTVHQSAIRALGWIKAPPCLSSGELEPLVNQDLTVNASGYGMLDRYTRWSWRNHQPYQRFLSGLLRIQFVSLMYSYLLRCIPWPSLRVLTPADQ